MKAEPKKMAAALAALDLYLEEEAQDVAVRSFAPPLTYPSLWSAAGRQGIMNNRLLVTARLWK